jgi:anti-sigma factor RsiW
MATIKMTKNEEPDVTNLNMTADNVFRPSWPKPSGDEPDTDVLVRVMRYLDDDLDPKERAEVEQELRDSAELRAILADMGHGTESAHRAYAAWNAEDVSSSRIATLNRPAARKSRAWPSSGYRAAAAIVVGLGIGLLGSRLATMPHDTAGTDLHLAGLNSTVSPQEAQQRALETALVPLLTGTAQQVEVSDKAAGLEGYLKVQRHLNLASGVPCTEFSFVAESNAGPKLGGLACQEPNGGWQTMTVDLDR